MNRTIFILGGLIAICFVIFESISKNGLKEEIWLEAENYENLKGPLELNSSEKASGQKILVTRGVHQGKKGYATYSFSTKGEGIYRIWTRCYWPHSCANSFLVSVNSNPFRCIGQDPVVRRWHWIAGFELHLTKGNHTLTLRSDEKDARIDKFLITSNLNFTPSGFGQSNNHFLDFKCEKLPEIIEFDNTEKWEIRENSNNNKVVALKRDTANMSGTAFIPMHQSK